MTTIIGAPRVCRLGAGVARGAPGPRARGGSCTQGTGIDRAAARTGSSPSCGRRPSAARPRSCRPRCRSVRARLLRRSGSGRCRASRASRLAAAVRAGAQPAQRLEPVGRRVPVGPFDRERPGRTIRVDLERRRLGRRRRERAGRVGRGRHARSIVAHPGPSAQRRGGTSTAMLAARDPRHRPRHEAVRPDPRARRPQLQRAPRPDLRLPRRQRRRQDDDDADLPRHPPAGRGRGPLGGHAQRRPAATDVGLPARGARAVSAHERPRPARLLRVAVRRVAAEARRAGTRTVARPASASRTTPTAAPRSSARATSRRSSSSPRSCTDPTCCSWTSRSPGSTRSTSRCCARRSSSCATRAGRSSSRPTRWRRPRRCASRSRSSITAGSWRSGTLAELKRTDRGRGPCGSASRARSCRPG